MTHGTCAGSGAEGECSITIHPVSTVTGNETAATGCQSVADVTGIKRGIMNILGNIGAAVTMVAVAVPGKFRIGMAAMETVKDHLRLEQMTGAAIDIGEIHIGI